MTGASHPIETRPEAAPSAEDPVFEAPASRGYLAVKEVIDRLGALLLLIWSLPLILAAMAAVRLTSRGSPIYTQDRLGRDGRYFRIYKIRSMYDRCEERSGPRWSQPQGDSRVTPVGRLLRKTHIDELPQLWNVLKGDMSLVGPRPERPVFARSLELAIPQYRDRLAVKPGMTGLAQVQLPPDTDLEGVLRKLTCDLYYIGHLGFATDVRILIGTACYLMGVPFHIAHARFGIPTLEMAEEQVDCQAIAEWSPEQVDCEPVAEWPAARPLPA